MRARNDSKSDTQQTSAQTKKHRVMIVDDEQDITTIFKMGLEKNEFIVTTFNDPLEALSKFRPGTYDLLILDIRMPAMNGFELYQKIRSLDDKVKVCFLTGFEEHHEEFKASFPLLDEVKCYLKKPITVQDLIKRLLDLAKLWYQKRRLKLLAFAVEIESFIPITDHYHATVGGLEYNISGRYSSSGRFKHGRPYCFVSGLFFGKRVLLDEESYI